MAGNGWMGNGDPMEEKVEQWLVANGINFRRADDMKTHLDFFLPDFQIYIEVKRFHTPRIDNQLTRASDIVLVQGMGCLKFLETLVSKMSQKAYDQGRFDQRVENEQASPAGRTIL